MFIRFPASQVLMRHATVVLIVLILAANVEAQRRQRPRGLPVEVSRQDAKTIELDGVPRWLENHEFEHKEFTFVRIRYEGTGWATDFPDADLNLAAQIGSMTNLDVSEPSRVLGLRELAGSDYPFAYLSEAGRLQLENAEVAALRLFLRRGGFLMVDDFWGEAEWAHLRAVMKRVLPEREPQDLPLSHPLFHCVFDLKEKPQVTSLGFFLRGHRTERADAEVPHYRAILDDDDQIMVLMCHNTDLADGWEHVEEAEQYTIEMSKKRALPMGINILFSALSNSK